jgi:hypothetical protein
LNVTVGVRRLERPGYLSRVYDRPGRESNTTNTDHPESGRLWLDDLAGVRLSVAGERSKPCGPDLVAAAVCRSADGSDAVSACYSPVS